MKAKQIYEGTQAIRVLMGEKFPAKASYSISRLAKKLEDEFKLLEDARISIVKKHGKEQPDGSVTISQDDKTALESFISEFNEILESEVDFQFIPLDIDQFGSITITPALLNVLDPFLKIQE